MTKRGRPSKASLEIATLNQVQRIERVSPPEWLDAQSREEFFDIVNSVDAAHFRPSDASLLARYCQSIVSANTAEKSEDFIAFTKLQLALATKLRLCPSARTRPETIARQSVPDGGRKPWQGK